MERDSIYEKQYSLAPEAKKDFVLLDLLIGKSYAAISGESCFQGTWASKVSNGSCLHPENIKTSGYKSNCSQGQFQCNPTFFGDGVCVEVESQYENIADTCLKSSGNSIADIKERLSGPDFQKTQKEVGKLCNRKSDVYKACSILNEAIAKIASARDSQPQMKSIIAGLEDTFDEINSKTRDKNCFEFKKVSECPEVLNESLEGIYWNGTVGGLNVVDQGIRNTYRYITGDDTKASDFRDPRATCASLAKAEGHGDEIYSSLQAQNPNDYQLKDFAPGCFSDEAIKDQIEYGREDEDVALAKSYLEVDFNVKNQRIKNAYHDLLDAKTQLANLIPVEKTDCKKIANKESSDYCEKLNSCSSDQNRFDDKLEETKLAFEQIRQLEKIKNDDSVEEDIQAQAQQGIVQILEVYPLLKGKHLSNIRSRFSKRDKDIPSALLRTQLTNQLKDSHKKINEKISDLDNAQQCLTGQGSDCDEFENTMDSINYNRAALPMGKNPHHNEANAFYSCIESQKENRNEANNVLDDVAIGVALSFTPMVAVNAIKLAATASRSIRAAAQSGKLAKNAQRGALAADLGYSAGMGVAEYNKCQEFETQLKAFNGKRLNQCSDIDMKMVSASNVSRCTSQALLTAALIGGPAAAIPVVKFAAKRFKSAKSVATSTAKTKTSKNDSNTSYDEEFSIDFEKPKSVILSKVQNAVTKVKDKFSGGSKDVVDDFRKEEFLLSQGYTLNQVDAVTRVTLAKNNITPAMQNEILSKAGLSKGDISLLRKNGLLEASDARISRLTTVAKMVGSRIEVGGWASAVDAKGNLSNIKIMSKLSNGKYQIAIRENGKTIQKTVDKSEIYQPILKGKTVLYKDAKGGMSEMVIEGTSANGVKLKGIEAEVSYAQLGLKPRTSKLTGGIKETSYLSMSEARDFSNRLENLKALHPGSKGELSKEYIDANNRFILKAQEELKAQGVHTSTFKDSDGTINLVMDSVDPGGNNVASLYLKAADRFNSQQVTFSINDNLRSGGNGFNRNDGSRSELGFVSLMKMLKGEKNTTALHEIRHQMYNSNRTAGKTSMYDVRIAAPDTAKMDLHGNVGSKMTKKFYGKSMSLEELYTHASDTWIFSKGLSKMTIVERVEKLSNINRKAGGLANLSKNTVEVANSIQQSVKADIQGYFKKQQYIGNKATLSDANGRTITIDIPDRPAALMVGGADNPANVLSVMNRMDLQEVVTNSANLAPEAQRLVSEFANKLSAYSGQMTPELAKRIVDNAQAKNYHRELAYITQAISKNIQEKELLTAVGHSINKIGTHAFEVNKQARKVYDMTDGKTIISKQEAADIAASSTKLGQLVRGH